MPAAFDLYIAGPMTGLPENNYPAFHTAAAQYRATGFTVLNPAENLPPCPAPVWSDWMRLGLPQLLQCRGIVLLPGWEHSRGARIEHDLAQNLGLAVFLDVKIDVVRL